MTKKEFFDLLVKFEQGKCSKEEENLLFNFYESFQKDNVMDSWNLPEKEQAKIRLLDRIGHSIANDETPQKRKWVLTKLSRAAAIFIGLIGLGYIYLQISSQPELTIPEGAITLELQDGSIKIIQETGDEKVLDQNGKVIGEQKGNQLVYNEVNTKELVL
ncbi:hypothetical protein [Flagellimonas sp.]|uniref:hypothetical protein n=1 Tax=Flagellimonas sp. TaxID=2058762 RepID=UPI003B593D50